MIDFGSNFRKLREWVGISQEAMANHLHVSVSVVNRIENNKRKLDIHLIHKLAIAVNLDILHVVAVLFEGKPALQNRDHLKSWEQFSAYYETIIKEKNQIIEAKSWYITQLEEKLQWKTTRSPSGHSNTL